jgi:signal transduction histidine kinase
MVLMNHDNHPPDSPADLPGTSQQARVRRRRWLVEGAAIVGFWSAVALLSLMQEAFEPRIGEPVGLHQGEVLHGFLEFGVWAALTPLIFWMSRRFTLERLGWQPVVPLYVIVGVAIALVVDLIEHALWNALVPLAPPRPVSLQGTLTNPYLVGEFSLYAFLLIAGFARAYFLRFQQKQQEAIQLRMEAAQLHAHLAEARLQALRMQINPHFLFNALHSISDGFEGDAPTARRMIARLSEILRYAFEGMDAQEVTLGQELRILDAYLEIQHFRFEEKLSVSQEIASDVREALVPNLILQPLVENAIKHGLSQLEQPGRIELRAWRDGEDLHLTVSDNGPGLTTADGGSSGTAPGGVGLHNTRERLAALYGSNQRCVLQSAPQGGLTVHLSLPYHTDADHKVVAVEES